MVQFYVVLIIVCLMSIITTSLKFNVFFLTSCSSRLLTRTNRTPTLIFYEFRSMAMFLLRTVSL